jgi:predicted enzyme related to lactoylglutathione lyase
MSNGMRVSLVAVVAVLMANAPFAAESWVESIRSPQYFAVSVEDVDRSANWYAKALGLEKLDDTADEAGRWRIVNLKSDSLFVEIIWDKRGGDGGRVRGIAKVGFQVPDVERVADRVEKALGTRPRILDFQKHGIRILQLKDPDGNTVQLSSPLSESAD